MKQGRRREVGVSSEEGTFFEASSVEGRGRGGPDIQKHQDQKEGVSSPNKSTPLFDFNTYYCTVFKARSVKRFWSE